MSKKIVSVIQTHIRAHSKLDVYDRISKQGFWRLLLLRTQDTGDVMLYLQINTIDLDPTLVMAELDALMKCLHSERERGEICLTTVLVEDSQSWFNGIGSSAKATTTITAAANAGNEETSGIDVDELLGKKSVYKIELGEGYIQENLLGIK